MAWYDHALATGGVIGENLGMAFVLQRVQNGDVTFSSHEYKADVFTDVRSNYGLTESEFLEFVSQSYLERPDLYMASFEGEIPEPESAFAKLGLKAAAKQRALKASR